MAPSPTWRPFGLLGALPWDSDRSNDIVGTCLCDAWPAARLAGEPRGLSRRTCVLMALAVSPLPAGETQKGLAVTMTVDTPAAQAMPTHSDTSDDLLASV